MSLRGYIGLGVRIRTVDGTVFEGTVRDIEVASQTLYLSHVVLEEGGAKRPYGELQVGGEDLEDLEILEDLPPHGKSGMTTSGKAASYAEQVLWPRKTLENQAMAPAALPAVAHAADSSHVPFVDEASAGPGSQPRVQSRVQRPKPSPQSHSRDSPRHREGAKAGPESPVAHSKAACKMEWAAADTRYRGAQMEEFDFQAGLSRFDKAKVFADIKQGDTTRPEERLYYQNALLAKESVQLQKRQGEMPDSVGTLRMGARTPEPPRDETMAQSTVQQSPKIILKRQAKIVGDRQSFMASSGRVIPTVTLDQMSAATEMPYKDNLAMPNNDQMAENAGQALSQMIMHEMALGRDVKAEPVLLLVGNHRCGAYALAAGRHLLNRNIPVQALFWEPDANHVGFVSFQKRLFLGASGQCFDSLAQFMDIGSELRFGFVVDAAMGLEASRFESLSALTRLIQWCNMRKDTPVLSLEIPAGHDHASGGQLLPSTLKSHWIATFGLPKTAHHELYAPGKLFLIDIGIPPAAWNQVLPRLGTAPFESSHTVMLSL